MFKELQTKAMKRVKKEVLIFSILLAILLAVFGHSFFKLAQGPVYDSFINMGRAQAANRAQTAEPSQPANETQANSTVYTNSQGKVVKVILQYVGEKKIQVIAAIRNFLECGMKDAKDLVDSVPSVVKEDVPFEQAQKIKAELEALEARVEIQ